ncbi:MAG: hypothetical protein NTW10_04410 [Bacteroidetes bacterium]|nr:hypothetical protein [Bacteroidota bacterium]
MANSSGNVITHGLRGKFGNQVIFKIMNGKSITANVPDRWNVVPVGGQIETVDRFKEAAIWAKELNSDPLRRQPYAALAGNGMCVYTLAVKDYMRSPVVTAISTGWYSGHVGDLITVSATDNFCVKGVTVRICSASGELIEEGPCKAGENNSIWRYRAVKEISNLAGIVITATATDNPGHTGTMSVTKEAGEGMRDMGCEMGDEGFEIWD